MLPDSSAALPSLFQLQCSLRLFLFNISSFPLPINRCQTCSIVRPEALLFTRASYALYFFSTIFLIFIACLILDWPLLLGRSKLTLECSLEQLQRVVDSKKKRSEEVRLQYNCYKRFSGSYRKFWTWDGSLELSQTEARVTNIYSESLSYWIKTATGWDTILAYSVSIG